MTKTETPASAAPACDPPGPTRPTDQVPKERKLFRALLAGNPNYFGNLATSPLPPVLPKQGAVSYTHLTLPTILRV